MGCRASFQRRWERRRLCRFTPGGNPAAVVVLYDSAAQVVALAAFADMRKRRVADAARHARSHAAVRMGHRKICHLRTLLSPRKHRVRHGRECHLASHCGWRKNQEGLGTAWPSDCSALPPAEESSGRGLRRRRFAGIHRRSYDPITKRNAHDTAQRVARLQESVAVEVAVGHWIGVALDCVTHE